MKSEQEESTKSKLKTFFVHIGLPKTGTSFLQQVLFENHEELFRSGIVYFRSAPPSHLVDGIPFGIFPHLKDENSTESLLKTIEHCARQLSESEFEMGLISNERICYFNRAWIENLRLSIPKNVELKIVLVLRNQLDMVNSLYIEQNHNVLSISFGDVDGEKDYEHPEFYENKSLTRILEHGSSMNLINRACDFYSIALDWSSVIGKKNTLFIVYEKSLLIFKDLLELMGRPDILSNINITKERVNVSASASYVEFIESLKTYLFRYLDMDALREKHKKGEGVVVFSNYFRNIERLDDWNSSIRFSGKKKSHLSNMVKKTIRRKYNHINRRFDREFMKLPSHYYFKRIEFSNLRFSAASRDQTEILIDGLTRLLVVSEIERMKFAANLLNERYDIYSIAWSIDAATDILPASKDERANLQDDIAAIFEKSGDHDAASFHRQKATTIRATEDTRPLLSSSCRSIGSGAAAERMLDALRRWLRLT